MPRWPFTKNLPMTTIAAASHADTETAPHGWRWAPAWVLAFVALWPAPGIAEGVMVLGALAAKKGGGDAPAEAEAAPEAVAA